MIATVSSAAVAQSPKQEQLLNGLKVLMWPDKTSDKVTVRLRVHAGAAFDQQGKEGTMQLLADNLFPNPAAREFFTEDLGGGLDIVTTYDYIQINASAKPDQLLTMLETLSSAIASPQFEKETTAQIQAALLTKLEALGSDPAYIADRAAASRLLGTFPYGRPTLGTPESVKKLVTADLIDARQRFLAADNATVAISGNFDRSLAFKAIRRYFGSWLKADRKIPSTFQQPADPPADVLVIDSTKVRVAEGRAAIRSTSRASKDFAPSQILAKVLQKRLESLIPGDRVFVRNNAYVQPGLLVIGFPSTTTGSDVIARIFRDAISDSEFQIARSAAAQISANRPVEEVWLDADTYRLGSVEADRNTINITSLADVRAVADRLQAKPIANVIVIGPID